MLAVLMVLEEGLELGLGLGLELELGLGSWLGLECGANVPLIDINRCLVR